MSFCIFIKLFRINRFSIFNNYVSLFYFWHMIFKNLGCIVHRDRNDRAAGLCRNFECAVFKRQHAQFITAVAGPLRENTDGYTSLDIINGREDSFQAFLWIFSVQEEAVNTFHPGGQCQVSFHFFFCDISGEPFASAVSQEDVKIAAVVSDEKDRLIRDIFFSDDSCLDAGHAEDHFKSPLYDAQRAYIPCVRVEFSEDPFNDKDGNGQCQIQDQKN